MVVSSCKNAVTSEEHETDVPGVYYDLNYPMIPDQEQSILPDSIRALYQTDASRLTVRLMLALGGDAANEVELPVFLVESLLNGLSAIYMAGNLAARDSVVDMFPIHTFLSPQMHEIIVSADSSRSFMLAWAAGNRFTGQSTIDGMLEKYDLHLENYYDFPWSHAVVLRSGRPLNIAALAQRFSNVPGVGYAESSGYCCDGPDIGVEVIDMKWVFSFYLKWGDCSSGCIARHAWTFSVGADGFVAFLGSTGSPILGK